MARYFHTTLARKPMALNGRTITFLPYSVSMGKISGVFKAEDPADIAALDDAVRGRRGVSEIDEAAFESSKKKAAPTQPSSNSSASRPRVVKIPLLPEAAVVDDKPGAAARSAGQESDLFTGPAPAKPASADLVKVGKLNPPKPFGGSDDKVRKAVKRADNARAKVRVARPPE